MSIITLTTDLGTKDYYVGSIKGAILSQFESANIVDISHDVPPFDISVAAFCVRNSYKDFPAGTVHIIGVSPEADEFTRHLLVKHEGQYFIGADNGIFSLLFDTEPKDIYDLSIVGEGARTFPTKDVFVKAACHIARGGTPDVIGRKTDNINQKSFFRAVTEDNVIKGMVTYIDSYGNILTNISQLLFKQSGKGRKFSIVFRRSDYNINEIKENYNEVPEGEKIALFSNTGNLEIAINKGHASKLFGLKLYDTIRVEFL